MINFSFSESVCFAVGLVNVPEEPIEEEEEEEEVQDMDEDDRVVVEYRDDLQPFFLWLPPLRGPTISSPQTAKGQVMGIVWRAVGGIWL